MIKENKLGICAWVLPGGEQDAFKIASDCGLDGVVVDYGKVGEIPFLDNKDHQELYKQLMKENELEIPTIALNLFCEKGMIHKENEAFAKEVFYKAIEIAVAMGIKSIQVPSFYNNCPETEMALKQTIKMLKYGCELAEKNGLMIGTENVFQPEQLKRVFKEVDSPSLTNLFDTANPYKMANQNSSQIAKAVEGFTSELHFKEFCDKGATEVCLGKGDVGFIEAVEVFVQERFKGWVQLESPYRRMENYEIILNEDIKIARGIFES